jgi:hypothetical protein
MRNASISGMVPDMSRTRLISLSVLAALVLSAVVLVPAAVGGPKTCGSSSTSWVFCYNNNEEVTSQKVEGTGGVAKLAVTIGIEAKFECESNSLAAELESSGKGKGTITLHKCKETSPEHCRLSAAEEKEIKISFVESLVGKLETGKAEAEFTGAQTGEEVVKITLEHENSECAISSGSYKITGKQGAELPGVEGSSEEHEFIATKELSDMKLGGNEVSLSSTTKVKLSSSHDGSSDWYVGFGS